MSIKSYLKTKPWFYIKLFNLLKRTSYFNFVFHRSYKNLKLNDQWKNRVDIVAESPDNKNIPRVKNAGYIYKKYQMMHNGIKINLGSYYSAENAYLLQKNKGVHEPQEEFVFQEVLKLMPKGAVMMELGSYWAFYSMWFAKNVASPTCYMIEPDPHKLLLGKWNFELNSLKGTFKNAFIGQNNKRSDTVPTVNIDSLLSEYAIDFLHLLHSDIQGFEYEMLEGATNALNNNKIGFIFISTHSNELHEKCIDKLKAHQFDIVCEADLNKSYSWDGLIVAKSRKYGDDLKVNISKRRITEI